ncbi:MAG: UMP kinase [Methanobacteriota archaeon]|nr:MAG: UMP kinase [Euryarchaeota archaeon]
MNIVLKVGGSILFENGRVKVERISQYVSLIKSLQAEGHSIAVIVGGGAPAREYSKVARELGASFTIQDKLGIEASRMNARLFQSAFDNAYPNPPTSFDELQVALSTHELVFVGGIQPGQSTNAVAALVAELTRADWLFNCSNIDFVYDKDPSLNHDAKPFDKLTYSQFIDIVNNLEQKPSGYALFDLVGAKIVQRSKIRLCFVNGKDPENVIRVLKGENKGTVVYDE